MVKCKDNSIPANNILCKVNNNKAFHHNKAVILTNMLNRIRNKFPTTLITNNKGNIHRNNKAFQDNNNFKAKSLHNTVKFLNKAVIQLNRADILHNNSSSQADIHNKEVLNKAVSLHNKADFLNNKAVSLNNKAVIRNKVELLHNRVVSLRNKAVLDQVFLKAAVNVSARHNRSELHRNKDLDLDFLSH